MIYTFGIKYSKEKYPYAGFKGTRLPKGEYESWYGGEVRFLMKSDSILLFVGEKGTLDAGVFAEDLEKVDVKELRQLYQNKTGKEPERVWQKPTLITKLTGVSQ